MNLKNKLHSSTNKIPQTDTLTQTYSYIHVCLNANWLPMQHSPTDSNEIAAPPLRPISNSPHLSGREDTMNRSLYSVPFIVPLILVSFLFYSSFLLDFTG